MLAFVFNSPSTADQRVARKRAANTAIADRELLQRIAQHDPQAFAALYDRYAGVLYHLSLAIVQQADEAEDILQECFLRVWEKAGVFDGLKGGVYTWLVAMTRNRAIDRLRSKNFQSRRQQPRDFDFDAVEADAQESPLEKTSLAERATLVRRAFAALQPEQREVLHLAYFAGYSQSEIAQHLCIPLGTVKTRTRQALQKMHIQLRAVL